MRDLRRAIEPCIVDSERRTPREIRRERHVLRVVTPVGLRDAEADHADDRTASDERYGKVRSNPDSKDQVRVLGARHVCSDDLGRHLDEELGLPAAEHARRRLRRTR